MQRFLIAVAVGGLLIAACGAGEPDAGTSDTTPTTEAPTTTTQPGIAHPTDPTEVVLRMEYAGGFVPLDYNLRRFPEWTLYGDGTLVTAGPQIEIYPPPALPNLLQRAISEEGIQALIEAARDAGLTGEDRRYDAGCIADAPDTVFTLSANGESTTVTVYALGFEDVGGECGIDEENAAARAALTELMTKITDLESWLPEGSVGSETQYEASALRVYVTSQVTSDEDLPQAPVDWPLDTPLASFGEPVGQIGYACGTLDGDAAQTLLDAAAQTNTLTPWLDAGEDYQLVIRPMLPDEQSC